MECYISPFTGQPSVLAAALEQTYGPIIRDRVMSYIYSDQFKDEHGWPAEENLDEQKEPTFAWVQENVAKKTLGNIKDGVLEVFTSNAELSAIGTPEQYSQYLDTIFPDSKVKDIVYRGSERGIENDNRPYLYFTSNKNEANIYAKTHFTKGGNINERNPIPSISKNIGEYIDNKYGKNSFKSLNADKQDFYEQVSENDYELRLPEWYKEVELSNEDKSLLKDFKDLKQMYDIVKIESEEGLMKQYDDTDYQNTKPKYDKLRNKLSPFFDQEQIGKIEPVILNIQNPYTEEIVQEDLQNNRNAYKNGHDGAFLMDGDHFVVKRSSEQIHILGSKQDIEGFKKFVSASTPVPQHLRFETEDDAVFAVQGTDGKGMKTGTVVEIAGKQYTVVNDTDKDIDFIPVGAPSTSTPQTVGTVVTGQTYTGNITALAPNQIFVFGSNAIGVNGNLATNKGGAALSALKNGWVKQGEKMTNRLSDSGKSWGLLTVTAPGKPLSMSRAEILSSIIIMYSAAAANPGKQFLVAYQGSAEKKNLNGYTNAQMADMFSQFKRPENVIFEKEFSTLLTEPPLQSSTPSTPVTQQPTFTIKGIEPPVLSYAEGVVEANKRPSIAQNFFDGYRPNSETSKVHAIRPEIVAKYGKGVKTITLVKEGVRTRTTRLANWMKGNNPKVGDYFWQLNEKNPDDKVLTRITAVYGKDDPRFKDNWFKEGWVDDNFKYVEGYDSAIEFEVVKEGTSTATSTTPVFDSLPGKSSTPTMTYAGIGSRETPAEVLTQMTEAAKYLESLGYTLNTGKTFGDKEEGADQAFSKGTIIKNLFGPEQAGDKEMKIAQELHPNWQALTAKGLGGAKLMARNTNQVFGKNLDTPVDFVLFYAQETSNPLRPKGGTGQAVEMARRKGIPTINMADADWRQQLETVLANKNKVETVPTAPTIVSLLSAEEATTFTPKNRRDIQVGYEAEMKQRFIDNIVTPAKQNPTQKFDTSGIFKNPDAFKEVDQFGLKAREWVEIVDQVRLEMGEDFPTNIRFSPTFLQAMNNSSRRTAIEFADRMLHEVNSQMPWSFNREEKAKATARIEVMTSSPDGLVGRSFSDKHGIDMQQAIEDKMMAEFSLMYTKSGGKVKVPYLIGKILVRAKQHAVLPGPLQQVWLDTVQAFAYADNENKMSFLEVLLDRLAYMGYRIQPADRAQLKNYFNQKKNDSTYNASSITSELNLNNSDNWEQDMDNYIDEMLTDIEVDDETSALMRSWQDTSFEKDAKNQASVGLKIFIGQQVQFEPFKYSFVTEPTADSIDIDALAATTPITLMSGGDLRKLQNKVLYSKNPDSVRASLEARATSLPKQSVHGIFPPLVDFDSLYEKVLEVLCDHPTLNFQEALGKLRATGNEDLKRLALRLEELSDRTDKSSVDLSHFQNEFLKVMRMQYTKYYVTKAETKKGKNGKRISLTGKVINAQRNAQHQAIEKEWRQNQILSPIVKIKDNGERVIDRERAAAHAEVIDIISLMAKKKKNDPTVWPAMSAKYEAASQRTKEIIGGTEVLAMLLVQEWNNVKDVTAQRTELKRILATMFKEHGIVFTPDALQKMVSYRINKEERINDLSFLIPKKSSFSKDFLENFSVTTQGDPSGIFSAFFRKAAKLTKAIDTDDSEETVKGALTEFNPLYSEAQTMRILSSVEGTYREEVYNKVHTTLEGKQNFDYSLPTTLSQLTKDLFEGITEYREVMRNSVWGTNPYLELPTANKIELGYLEGLNTQKKDSGVVRKDMSDREQLMSSIILYQNNGKKTAYMLSLTHSDKTTSPVFANVPKLKALNRDGSFSKEMIEAYGAMFNSEWSRILNVQNLKKRRGSTGNKAMDAGGEKFFFFPTLNSDALGAEKDLLWNEDGTIKDDLSNDDLRRVQQKMIEYMTLLCDRTEEYWKKQGIDETMFDKAYKEKVDIGAEMYRTAVEDYTLNSTLWNMSASVLLLGDPANAEWKGSIDATLKEYSKRLAKDIAPGYQLAYEDTKYASLTIKDVTLSYDYIIASGGNIDASKATDGQEFVTAEEYLKILKAKGAIGHDLFNTLMRKVEKFDTAEEEEFTAGELEALGQPMNPMKPVYAGPRANSYDPSIIHYDYIKTSAYPLLPWLTRGKAIDHLRLLMEGKKIFGMKYARVVFESGSKMGNSSDPVSLFDKNENFVEPSMEALAANTRALNRRYLSIQQEVPFEESKEEIGIVTQMDKLIVEGILKFKDFQVGLPGQTRVMTGEEVRRTKEKVRIDMLKIAHGKLLKKLDVLNPNSLIKPEKVIELLIDSARVGEYSPNERALLESLFTMEVGDKPVNVSSVPIFFQSAVDRFTKLLLAQVKKTVKMKMPGRSYVLGSSIGFVEDLTAQQRKGIVMVPGKSLDTALKFARKENGKVLPAQVIAPFNFVVNGVRQKVSDYLTPEGLLDMDRVPAELLHLIGARIPNQGHNSMLPIEIVGFIPDWMGDLMLVPSAITGQMGSDFDVDKLYTYQRPYTKVKGADGVERLTVVTEAPMRLGANEEEYQDLVSRTEAILKKVGEVPDDKGRYNQDSWKPAFTKAVAEKYPDGNVPRHQSELVSKKEENHKATYFNLHWAVLTHPEVYSKMASMLDKPDLGNKAPGQANYDFAPKNQKVHSYFNPTDQLQQFQSGKDAKSLVAITSLASVFDANMQDKNLRYGNYDENMDGTVSENPRYLHLNGLALHHISGEGITSNGYSKHDNITIDQSGAADNAKDRTLDNLNITVATYPAYTAMNLMHDESGKSLDKIFMAAFSSQKILWEYTEEYRKTNDAFDEEFSKDVSGEAIKELRKQYTEYYKKSLDDKTSFDKDKLETSVNATDVTLEMLTKAFNEGSSENPSSLYYIRQLAVLKAFEEAVEIGDRVGVLQKTFNQDTKGPGTDLVYVMQQLENYKNLVDTKGKVFLGEDELAEGQLGETFELTVPLAYSLLASVMPVNTIEGLFKTITTNQGKDITKIGQATKTAVMSHLRAAFISSSPILSMDPQITRRRLLYGTDTEKSLAVRVLELKSKVKDNFFLRRLEVELGLLEGQEDEVIFLTQKSPRLIDNKIIQDFLRLVDSSDPEVAAVAKDLVVYAMLITPTPTAKTFISKLPAGVILGTTIASNLRQRYTALVQGDFPPTLIDQIYQHLPELAMKLPETAISENNPIYKLSDRDYPEVISISKVLNGKTSPTLLEVEVDSAQGKTYTPYLKFYSTLEGKQVLYKLRNSAGDAVDYVRIDTLGKEGKVEYDLCDPHIKSIFPENRSGGQFSYPSTTQSTHDMVDHYTTATTDPGNAFTRWGLPAATGENGLARALGQLSTDPVVPTYLRTLANQLAVVGFEIEKNFSQKAFETPLRVKIGNTNDYKVAERTITLRPSANIKQSAEHLVHETVHARTSSMLHSMGWRPYSHFVKAFEGKKTKEQIDAIWESYLKEAAKVSSRLPELYAKAAALDRLRLKALKELENRIIASGLDLESIKNEAETGNVTTEEGRIYYSLNNLIEFVPNTLSNEETIKFLNTVEATTKKSWFENLRDMVYEFVTEVLKALGKDYNKNSILRECLELSFELTTIKQVEESISPTGQLVIQKYVLENEQQARHLKDIGETVFGHVGKITDKGTHHEVEFSDKAPSFTAPYITKALTNLQRQVEVLEAVRGNIQGKSDAARKKKAEVDLLIKEVQSGAEQIQKSGELETLTRVAKEQLQWVEALLKKTSTPGALVTLTMSELRMGYSIVNVWKDLQEARTFFVGSTDDRIFNIEGLARNLFDVLLTQSRKTVIETSQELTGITGTVADLGINIQDIAPSQAWTIGLERDTQKINQIIATIGQYQVQNANEERDRLFKDLKKLQTIAKGDVNFYKKLMQESDTNTVWGLIQKLAPHWYQGNAEQRKKIRNSMIVARNLRKGSGKAKNIAKKVYREFWKYADSVGTVIPVGELFDMETGARLATPEAQTLLNNLRSTHVEGTVDEALEQIEDYLQDYIQQRELTRTKLESVEAEILFRHLTALNAPLADITIQEKDLIGSDKDLYASLDDAGKQAFLIAKTEEVHKLMKADNAKEAMRLTKEELQTQLQAWEKKNSVAEFLNTRGVTDAEYLIDRENDKFWLVPKAIKENLDPKFEAMEKDPALKEAYDIVKYWSQRLKDYLPITVSRNMHANFLPAIPLHDVGEMLGLMERMKENGVMRTFLEKISVSPSELARKNEDKIPLNYVYGPKRDEEGKILQDEMSYDLPRVLELFGDMAIQYHYAYPVQEIFQVIRTLVASQNTNNLAEGKKGLGNLMQLMKYYEDMLVFKRSKDLEMVAKTPTYSLKASTNRRIKKEVSDTKKRMMEIDEEVFDLQNSHPIIGYKLPDDHPLLKEKEKLETKLKEYEKQARYLAGSRAGDVMINIQQLKSMSYNPFSMISNLTFGYLAARMHGRGFRAGKNGYTDGDYTNEQLSLALKLMKGNISSSVLKLFGTTGGEMAEKVRAFIQRTKAIEALIDTQYGQSNLSKEKSDFMKFFDPYAGQKSGDFLMKGAVIIARALNTPVEVLVDGQPTTINLFEATGQDGHWDKEKYGENKAWSSETPEDQKEWNKFLYRTRKTLTLIFGNQDKNMPLLLRSKIAGRLLGQFRLSWIPEGIKTRWGGMQGYDESLGRKLEGRYRTMFRMNGWGFPLLLKQALSTFTGENPFEGQTVRYYDEDGVEQERAMESFEIENMRRNLAGLSYSAFVMAMYFMLKASLPNEDELRRRRRMGKDGTTAQRMTINMLFRIHQDLAMYTSPDLFQQLLGNPVPSWSVVGDALKAAKSWGKVATDEDYTWKQHWMKQTKVFPYINLINKIDYYANKDLSTVR